MFLNPKHWFCHWSRCIDGGNIPAYRSSEELGKLEIHFLCISMQRKCSLEVYMAADRVENEGNFVSTTSSGFDSPHTGQPTHTHTQPSTVISLVCWSAFYVFPTVLPAFCSWPCAASVRIGRT